MSKQTVASHLTHAALIQWMQKEDHKPAYSQWQGVEIKQEKNGLFSIYAQKVWTDEAAEDKDPMDLTVKELLEMGADVDVSFHNHDTKRTKDGALAALSPFTKVGKVEEIEYNHSSWFAVKNGYFKISSYFDKEEN